MSTFGSICLIMLGVFFVLMIAGCLFCGHYMKSLPEGFKGCMQGCCLRGGPSNSEAQETDARFD